MKNQPKSRSDLMKSYFEYRQKILLAKLQFYERYVVAVICRKN